jgi:APA family basic amino acid/polyamine antiporter
MTADQHKSSGPDEPRLERFIGLTGGVALVIGGVIGMGIYALIAAVAAQAGSALWLAFTLALVISAIGVAPLIMLAGALPRAGGGYLFASRLLNPLVGTIASYLAVLGGAGSTALVALGLAGYLKPYLPQVWPVQIVAILLPLAFYLLYYFGLRLAASLQVILAAQLIIALAGYGLAGLADTGLSLSLTLPQGVGGLVMATIMSYSVCMGFQVIGEMGEEMVNPRRNIPLALLIGGAVILVVYILVGSVFVGSIPYNPETFRNMTAPLTETGKIFLPEYWLIFLSLGAVSAGLTSFNAGAIALPRELFAQARDGLLPGFFAQIDARTHSPRNAVGAYFLLVVLILLAGPSIDFCGVMAAVGILAMTAILGLAAVRLPSRFPERYQQAYFKMPPWLLVATAVISVVSCLGFIVIVLMEMPLVGLVYLVWIAAVVVYYHWRVHQLKARGVDWAALMKTVPGHDEVE